MLCESGWEANHRFNNHYWTLTIPAAPSVPSTSLDAVNSRGIVVGVSTMPVCELEGVEVVELKIILTQLVRVFNRWPLATTYQTWAQVERYECLLPLIPLLCPITVRGMEATILLGCRDLEILRKVRLLLSQLLQKSKMPYIWDSKTKSNWTEQSEQLQWKWKKI